MSDENERQVGGTHYATHGIQHWDYVRLALKGRYLEGNITKYAVRYKKKNGLLDVQKAIHYLDKLESLYTVGVQKPMLAGDELFTASGGVAQFCDEAGLDYWQRHVVTHAASWRGMSDLQALRRCLIMLADDAHGAEPDRHYVDQD